MCCSLAAFTTICIEWLSAWGENSVRGLSLSANLRGPEETLFGLQNYIYSEILLTLGWVHYSAQSNLLSTMSSVHVSWAEQTCFFQYDAKCKHSVPSCASSLLAQGACSSTEAQTFFVVLLNDTCVVSVSVISVAACQKSLLGAWLQLLCSSLLPVQIINQAITRWDSRATVSKSVCSAPTAVVGVCLGQNCFYNLFLWSFPGRNRGAECKTVLFLSALMSCFSPSCTGFPLGDWLSPSPWRAALHCCRWHAGLGWILSRWHKQSRLSFLNPRGKSIIGQGG